MLCPRRLSPLLLALAVTVGACSIPERSSDAPTVAPVTTAGTETCRDAEGDMAAMCEAIGLIEDRYIDPIDERRLVEVADEAVSTISAADPAGSSGLRCGTTEETIDHVCRTIDDAGVPVATGVEAVLDAITLDALDPYSEYLNPEEFVAAAAQTRGQVEGIGALVSTEDTSADEAVRESCAPLTETCHMIIVSVFDGGPASNAGLLSGDRVVAVDGTPVTGMTLDEVTETVRGPSGSQVTLDLIRTDRFSVKVTRAAVDVPVVETRMVDDVGYLRLAIFTDASSQQVSDGLRQLLDQGATSLIVDLRDNPGGTLDSAVAITSQFLTEGVVVRTEAPDRETPYDVIGEGVATDRSIPVAVLINRGSASAAEVMAGALGEAGRATLIGEASFGKNTVQQRFGLDNGGAIKLTVARWVTPEGFDFGSTGITPDITAELSADLSPEQLVAEVKRLIG